MEIVLETSGGFLGLSPTVTIDTTGLEAAPAMKLESLLEDARFFDRPAQGPEPPPGAADYQTYVITVRDHARHHRIEVAEPTLDPELARLVFALEELGRPASRPGGD